MPFDPISYMLAKKKLNKKDYKLSTLPIDTDLNMGGFKITDLGEPVDPNDAPTRRYVDVATTGLGINYYFLDAADAEVPAYKQLSLTPPELAEAYVETAQNSAGDYEIGSWIAPADSIPTLRLGVFTTHFQAERISGNIDVRFFFRLYERDTLGTETLIAESSLSDIVTDRRDVVTSLILASDHVMAAGSRLVLKIFVRFLSSGASTTVRIYYQGDVRSRLATPIAKEVLDTIYAAILHASQHELGGDDELSLDASQIASGVFDVARIPDLPRSKITDFFASPFWDNIPDKPSILSLNVVTVTSNYTASSGDIVLVDASGGAITVTLPSPQANAIVNVKKIDSSANPVTIDGNGANIDEEASIQITTQYESYTLISDGSNWWII